MEASTEYDVVVVGGGIAGLTSGYRLRDHRLLVLEAGEDVGGRVKSHRRETYWVNLGAQFLAGEGPLWDIAEELGVASLTLRGSHPALAMKNRILVTESPARVAFGLPVSPAGRLAMLRLGLKIRGTYKRLAGSPDPEDRRRFRRELDQVSAARFFSDARHPAAQAVLAAFVRFWMGTEPDEVAAGHTAVYLGLSVANLSEVPPFSLVKGGNQELPRALARALGDRVQTQAEVEDVTAAGDRVQIRYRRGGERHEVSARECVVAVPAHVAPQIVSGLPPEKYAALRDVQYGTYISVGFFTDERGPRAWDTLYAATVVDKQFQVVINPATVLHRNPDARPDGGALLVYAGGDPARRLLERSDEQIVDTFRRDLEALLPQLRGHVVDAVVQRWPNAIPYWKPGERRRAPMLRESVGRIHFAGDYVAYPSMQVAANSASAVAERVGARFTALGAR